MICEVLGIKPTRRADLRIAHIKVGNQFGDAICSKDFIEAKQANLKPNLRVRDGRFLAFLEVENLRPNNDI